MDLILYHGDCPDGFCAAFMAKKRWPSAVLVPCVHGTPPPIALCQDRRVLVVDFSWARPVCEAMFHAAASLMILDHHATAESALRDLPYARFDLTHSGAYLATQFCWPDLPIPWYVKYVEDRDLFKFNLPDSQAVNAYIMALPHTIEAWNILEYADLSDIILSGTAIRLHISHYVEKVVAQRRMGTWQGHRVAVVNAAYLNISDVCHALLDYADIGVGYFERGDGHMQFSLRSKAPLNVSTIAKSYGGGGHPQAAGFELSIEDGRHVIDNICEEVASHV